MPIREIFFMRKHHAQRDERACRFVNFFDAQNYTRSPMASAISWICVRWNRIFTKRHMRLKLCCVKIWHYFDKVFTWNSRVDGMGWLSFYMLNSFKLNLQHVANSSWKKYKIFIRVLLENLFRASAIARATSWIQRRYRVPRRVKSKVM